MVIYINLNMLAKKLKFQDASVNYRDFDKPENETYDVGFIGGEKIPNPKKLFADWAAFGIREKVTLVFEGKEYYNDASGELTEKERRILKQFGLEEKK